jgi:hypothetical protein
MMAHVESAEEAITVVADWSALGHEVLVRAGTHLSGALIDPRSVVSDPTRDPATQGR